MKKSGKTLANAIMLTVLSGSSAASLAAKPYHFDPNNVTSANVQQEGCYGIAKKRMNDCGNSAHACAGQQVTNKSTQDFMMVLKGNCEKITGGLPTVGCQKGCTSVKSAQPKKGKKKHV